MAKNEVHYFVNSFSNLKDIQKNSIDLSQTNFIYISLYDISNKLILFKKQKSYEKIQNELQLINHHLVLNETEELIHNHIENKFYLTFKVPISMPKFHGSVQGLYKISDTEIQDLYRSLFYSILELVITVFTTMFLLYPIIVHLNKAYKLQSKKLLHANLDIMSVLGSAIAKRDNETNAHNYRVTLYSIAFGEKLKLSEEKMMGLIKGAFLHDVGKIGVSDTILLKPEKLTQEEFSLMKQHVAYGLEIISKSRWLDDAKDIVAYHHERYDGTGYLQGLSKEEIPLNARIFMLCDVFDALSSSRPYKKSFSFEITMQMINERAGGHFDPELVTIFNTFIEEVYTDIITLQTEEALKEKLHKKLLLFEKVS